MITIPTVKTLFLIMEEEYLDDLRTKFRGFFSDNILFSLFLGVLMLLKTYGFFNFTTLFAMILIYTGVSFLYKKYRKPRRIRRI